ncbi:SDR family oxidoreductase [Mucilaginibacter sp.]|jgi:NAD(P)-dependent dehydrogenase (short-subunit alcohol dehydrogenase family)|uniref:SDR family oxidoreductase n=1 Tax=Mucilaginibacter sp. TaxID=1882438 RepID=UPI002BBB8EE4|nr:SDR family oxidoreductase [Mucilaginibacter sp.]HTI59498.1 SDR family oxidoreductase [Mucilaginibacter sp.]
MAAITTVITGSTSGIGKVTALELAKKGHAIYMLVRNTPKGERVREEIVTQTGNKNIYVIRCDVSDLQSVREAAAELKEKLFGINILINNAGSAFQEKQLSKDGFEMTFALNHLGHFLLTMSLMPLLERGQARIINVSSEGHQRAKPNFDDLKWEHTPYKVMKAYGISKLYNIYFTKSLAEKYKDKGIVSYALHPGVVNTNIWDGVKGVARFFVWVLKLFMITPEKGAETVIYLATHAKLEKNSGKYFIKCKVAKNSVIADNAEARNKLWAISEKLVKI